MKTIVKGISKLVKGKKAPVDTSVSDKALEQLAKNAKAKKEAIAIQAEREAKLATQARDKATLDKHNKLKDKLNKATNDKDFSKVFDRLVKNHSKFHNDK